MGVLNRSQVGNVANTVRDDRQADLSENRGDRGGFVGIQSPTTRASLMALERVRGFTGEGHRLYGIWNGFDSIHS